jgi:hypothetical protein
MIFGIGISVDWRNGVRFRIRWLFCRFLVVLGLNRIRRSKCNPERDQIEDVPAHPIVQAAEWFNHFGFLTIQRLNEAVGECAARRERCTACKVDKYAWAIVYGLLRRVDGTYSGRQEGRVGKRGSLRLQQMGEPGGRTLDALCKALLGIWRISKRRVRQREHDVRLALIYVRAPVCWCHLLFVVCQYDFNND